VFSLAMLPDGRTLLSGGSTTLHAWDIATRKEIRTFRTALQLLAAVAVSADGKRAVSLDGQGRVQVWVVEKGEALRQLDDTKAPAAARHALAFSADGKRVASSDAAAI